MVLGQKIEKYLGEDLYVALDVTRSDYETLPAADFYDKVEKSCRMLRPDIIDELEKEDQAFTAWKTFASQQEARQFCNSYAKGKFSLCVKIMDDIFWNDEHYRLFTGGSFRTMRDIYLNQCKETGRKSFMESLRADRNRVIDTRSGITVGNMVAFIMGFAPRYCYQYCRVKDIVRYFKGDYIIDKPF
jgi:hypothetical protein